MSCSFLGQWVEVELSDGRLITGQLACADQQPNFILNKAEERWIRGERARHIGMAMLARRHVRRILMMPPPEHSTDQV